MGQVCTKPDEDENLELIHDRSVQVVEVPIKRRIRPLNTDSLEALQSDTNPFKDDLHRPLANEPERAQKDCAPCVELAPSKDSAKKPAAPGAPAFGEVALTPGAGRQSVQALAFPYSDAPALGEILSGERAELVSECGGFVQVRWNGLKVWVAAEQALRTPTQSAPDMAGATEDTDDHLPATACSAGVLGDERCNSDASTTCEEGPVWFVGQAVDLYAHDWVPAKVTGVLSSGLVQVRGLASSVQAAEDGVEAQCGVWLDRQQQQTLLRPRGAPAPHPKAVSFGANASSTAE